jgi:hypothetical protein
MNGLSSSSSCLSQIQQGFYSVQEKIYGLCSTDCKIYTLLIVGRVLQAAAIATVIATAAFLFSVGPIALIGCPLAVLMGILGSHLADGPGRPFVPGQPVGLNNTGGNCWLNSGLQLLDHVPAFKGRASRIPELASFLASYQTARAGSQKVADGIDTAAIRRFLSRSTGGAIDPGRRQQDAAQLFEYLFEGGRALYTFDQEINGMPAASRREPLLALNMRADVPFHTINSLLADFFEETTSLGQRRQLFFPRAPNDLLIQFKRFYWDPSGAAGKIDGPIGLAERFRLPVNLTRSRETAFYECDAFINHCGTSLNAGHYVTYVKKEGVWWYCSDSVVYEVSESEAWTAMQQSYIIHFKKV